VTEQPGAFSPSAEPQIYVGIITSLLISAGLVTTGEATTLQPLLLAVIVALPTVLAIIQRQFATPNAKVAAAVQAAVTAATASTPPVTTAPVTPPQPAPVTTSAGSTHMALTIVSSVDLPAGTEGNIPAETRRWAEDGELLGTIGPSLLAFDKEVVLSGSIHGTFWHAATTPPVYIVKADVTPVGVLATASGAPVTPFAGSFTATYLQALAVANNAGPDANLTVNEYAVLVTGRVLTLDWLSESAHWMADNLGSISYLSQLFNRMNLLVNAIQHPDPNGMPALVNGGLINGAAVLPAIGAIQAEINRCELLGRTTGTGTPARALDPATFLPALVRGEGDYVEGSAEVRSTLMSAGIGAAPTPTNAWQAQLAAAAAAGIMTMAQ
jgi:hypothetical protein